MLSLIVKDKPKSTSYEAYRTLTTNLQFSIRDKNVKKIIFSSAEAGEGKSTTVSNLALSFSQIGKKVLIIDCNLIKPTIHKYFNISNHTGFADLIIEKLNYKDVIQEYSDNLHIITAGKSTINHEELLSIEYVSPIFDDLQSNYDFILIDTPPLTAVTDGQLLATISDGVIMVLSIGQTHKKMCEKAIQLLNNVNANIIGIILNKATNGYGKYYSKSKYPFYEKEKKRSRKAKKKEITTI